MTKAKEKKKIKKAIKTKRMINTMKILKQFNNNYTKKMNNIKQIFQS